ncbi:hypothetical protein HHK36_015564 [Tetracentron sinense]|uniref:PWWP domain-containing protein n=1 Tax=Tetracentron sinense TaxID=13715 RepID=A0A835DGW4_TETSI|nr:hypothetical protein HHK36_015564 [Tetracentron sinense]
MEEAQAASEPAKAQTLENKTLKEVSGVQAGMAEVSVAGTQENGIRVSVNKNECLDGDVVVVATRVVETEVSVNEVPSMLDTGKNRGTGGEEMKGPSVDGGGVAETPRTGDSLGLQENGKGLGQMHENENKTVVGDVSVPEVTENEKIDIEKITSRINGRDSARKIEVSGNGVSRIVKVQDNESEAKHSLFRASKENLTSESEVQESGNGNSDNKSVSKDNGALLPENEEDQCAKVTELPEMTENSTVEKDEGNEKEEVSDEEEEEEEEEDQEYDFSVGDFVWGKIKSHPWWPGQIYDPSDASKFAAKYQRRDRLLVAYFGDGTFAWCYPSQLKPFQENFERMSKQSNSKSFLFAVEEAVDKIRRHVELEMTCLCTPKETGTGLTRPLAVNTGIKEGITVLGGGIGEFSITQYEPAKFIARLRYIAQVVSITSMLELTVIKSQLSAFYCAKGYNQLPMYHQPHEITDPENNTISGRTGESDLDGQMGNLIPSPSEEDWLSSPIGPYFGKAGPNSSQKRPGISEDKLYQRKKQKSMAELLGWDMDVEPENYGSVVAKEATFSGKPASTSRKKRRNKDSEVANGSDESEEVLSGSKLASPTKKRKKTRLLGSPTTAGNKGSRVAIDDGVAKEETKQGFALRERKKSKYLTPPYTILNRGHKGLNSSRDSETEILKVPKVSRVGECMSRAAGQLIGSPPIVKCSGETFQKKPSKEASGGRNTSDRLSPRKPKLNQSKIVPKESNASANEILSEFQSAALDALYLKKNQSSDSIKGFFSRLRSSLYLNGSNYKIYKKHLAGQTMRTRKSLDAKPGSLGKDKQQTGHHSLQGKSDQKKLKRKEDAMPKSPKITKPGLLGKDKHEKDHHSLQRKSDRKKIKRKDEAMPESPKITNPGSSRKDKQDTDHDLLQRKSDRKTIKRKEEALPESPKITKPGSSKKAKQETDHHSLQGRSDRKKIKRKEEAMPESPKITKPGSLGKDKQESDHHSLQGKSVRKKIKRKEEVTPESPKITKPGLLGIDKQEIDHHSLQGKSVRKKIKRKDEPMLESPKIKCAVGTDVKTIDREEPKGEALPVALLLTFAQGFPLPSKDDLNTKFTRFGVLNESETEVLEDSGCARVVYLRSSDAEAAFNSSEKNNPFGPAVVSYRLRYLSAASRALELDGNSIQRPPSPPVEGDETPAKPSAFENPVGETPPLILIRQNLEVMTSVLEKSGDQLSSEVKADLEDDIKGLLEKVSTMVESSSY